MKKQPKCYIYTRVSTSMQVEGFSLDALRILSSIVKCPICGSGMYGNVNRKKRKDGTLYKDYFYYACKHRTYIDGHHCTYKKQWNEFQKFILERMWFRIWVHK